MRAINDSGLPDDYIGSLLEGDHLLPPGKAKEALEKALERGDQAIAEGRDSIHDLRSSTVIGYDLAPAVAALGDEVAFQGSATFGLTLEGTPRNANPILRDEIYRIAREAVRKCLPPRAGAPDRSGNHVWRTAVPAPHTG